MNTMNFLLLIFAIFQKINRGQRCQKIKKMHRKVHFFTNKRGFNARNYDFSSFLGSDNASLSACSTSLAVICGAAAAVKRCCLAKILAAR